jgi:hypothetical protein
MLHRLASREHEDFTSRFIEHGTSGGTPMAAVERDVAITALNADGLDAHNVRAAHNRRSLVRLDIGPSLVTR